MTPDQMRATAERLARENYDARRNNGWRFWRELSPDEQDTIIDGTLAGLTHRDRTAEREAASKAWYAGYRAAVDYARNERRWLTHAQLIEMLSSCPASSYCDRDRYLAAEFGAGERVTLSDGSVVTLGDPATPRGFFRVVQERVERPNVAVEDWRDLAVTGEDFEKLKRLAEQRGAER